MLEFNAALSTVVEINQKSQEFENSPIGVKPNGPLSTELLGKMHHYWCAANYLCVGQIYLLDNPLLREPLTKENIKPRLLGHWGTSAGQNFIYVHLNRLIRQTDANIIYISGPGHGGPTLNACAYLEGTYTDVHPEITQDISGMRLFFRSFSTPGGVPSHCGPHTPNSMHEGGELGYSLVHAFGAAFDNPVGRNRQPAFLQRVRGAHAPGCRRADRGFGEARSDRRIAGFATPARGRTRRLHRRREYGDEFRRRPLGLCTGAR